MRDPGLVEYMGGQLFRARVFPIQPSSDQRIEIRFTQALDYENGVVHYRYPLQTGGSAAQTLEDMTIPRDRVAHADPRRLLAVHASRSRSPTITTRRSASRRPR